MPVPPAAAFCAGGGPSKEEEIMEQEPQEVETEGCEHTVEAELLVSNLQTSTESDRQMEVEDEMGLSDESTGDPADRPTDGTAVKLIEGHPSDDELTEGHPPDGEIAGGHPPSLIPSLMMSSYECVAGHVTFKYKRDNMQWGDGSVTQDLQEVGPLKACTGSNMSGVSL